jgi:folate-binding protein YgfZ
MFSAEVYRDARERAARLDRQDRGLLVVSGADRASYLHGLLTNDIASLQAGSGCYAAYLTPQGRMIADLYVLELGDVILVTTPREQTAAVLEKLDQFVFGEDVQLANASDTFTTIGLIGPESSRIVSSLTGIAASELDAWPEHANRRIEAAGAAGVLARVLDAGEPGYDLHIEAAGAAEVARILDERGVPVLDRETAEGLRLESGYPRFNADMDQETIPLEAGIEPRAISFTKGCYVGQEVIIRVLHRGHGRVVRKLVGLLFHGGEAPSAGAVVDVDGRDIGRVTSAAWSGGLGAPIALAYLHRDFLTAGTHVMVGPMQAVVHDLPFVPRRAEHPS